MQDEARYRALFEGAGDAVFVMKGETFIDCNPKALELYGCEAKSELVGTTPWRFSPERQPDGLCSMQKAREIVQRTAQGESQQFYWQHRRRDGTVFDAEVSLTSLQVDHEQLVLAVVRNLTEAWETNRSLRASEYNYRLLAEHATDMISRHAPDGTYRYASPAVRTILGYDSGELVGRDPYALYHPDDIPAVEQSHTAILEGERIQTVQYRFRRKDGTYTWLETTSKTIRSEDGMVREIIAISRDASERIERQKQVERQAIHLEIVSAVSTAILGARNSHEIARAALNRLEALVPFHAAYVAEACPEADQASIIAVAGLEKVRPFTRDLSAFGTGSILHASTMVHVPYMKPDDAQCALEKAIFDKGARSYVTIPLTVEEETIGVFSVTRDAPGAFSDCDLGLLQEVADLIAVALQQARYRHQLIEAKEQAEAARQEAEAARDVAEEMNQLKSAFLANMSHEVRTPLTSVIGFSELLGEMDLPDSASEFVGIILRGGKRLLNTLNAVLDLSQLEAGTMTTEHKAVALLPLVNDLVCRFTPRAREAGVELKVAGPSEPIQACTDQTALSRIISNLIDNAIKFTEEGGCVMVRLHLEGKPDACEAFHVAVEDSGIGIDPAFLPEIFDAFKQESVGDAREFEGGGLGLSIVQKLVRLMDGHVSVESEKGAGTTVRVRLPLHVNCP
jgi:PAS domain S-box-containing protein